MNERVGIHCLECDTYTEFDHEPDHDDGCDYCQDDIDAQGGNPPMFARHDGRRYIEAFNVEIIVIEPCPHDPNAYRMCDDDNHHWGDKLHYRPDQFRPERIREEVRLKLEVDRAKEELLLDLDYLAREIQNDRSKKPLKQYPD